jgi:hypothetical protein
MVGSEGASGSETEERKRPKLKFILYVKNETI